MMARKAPAAPPSIALASPEIAILDRVLSNFGNRSAQPGILQLYQTKLARPGGYLGRAFDTAPGNIVVRRGLRRLSDILAGAEIGVGENRR